MNNPMVFLSGCHKSGSSLLRSLFYGHSETLVVPIESHSMKHMGNFTINPYQQKWPSESNPEIILDNIEQHLRSYEISRSRLSDARILKGSVSGFMTRFKLNGNQSKEHIIRKYLISLILEFSNQEFDQDKIIIEKSVTNAEFTMELSLLFPKSKFIHILRNPYSNLVSLRKYNTTNQKGPFLLRLLDLLRNNIYFLYKNRNLLGNDRFLTIRYEDLISMPGETMEKVSKFIGINYSDKLIYPKNALGDTWHGNSTTGKKFKAISSSKLNDYLEYIHPLEVLLVNDHFSYLLKEYDYEILEQRGSVYKMFPNESMVRYIINRLTRRLIRYWNES